MPDPTDPEVPAAITDEPQAGAVAPTEAPAVVRTMTHEVDTDDIFRSVT